MGEPTLESLDPEVVRVQEPDPVPPTPLEPSSELVDPGVLEELEKKKTKKKKGRELELAASVASTYSSNPFHYSNSDLDDFDDDKGGGERFDGLESEWDVITTVSVGGTLDIPITKRRKWRLGLEGEHNLFLQNSLADYSKLEGKASYDFTRRDKGTFEIDHTPSRFKKNYRLPSGLFDDASYQQTGAVFDYERELGKDWSAGIGLEYYDRQYNSAFDSRDRDLMGVFAHTEVELKKNLSLEVEIAFEEVDTEVEDRGAVQVDRSYDRWKLTPVLKTEIHDWDVRFRIDYARREYTTDERADDGRFNRVDDKYGVRIQAEREVADGVELSFLLGWRENDADLDDPTVPADETNYDELVAGVGLHFYF